MAHENLTKIPLARLTVGMRVRAVEGSWLSHSLWRGEFDVTDVEVLERVRRSGAQEFWIEATEPDEPPVVAALPDPSSTPAVSADGADRADRAGDPARVLGRAKPVVRQLFSDARLGKAIDGEACLGLVDDIMTSCQRDAQALTSLARLKRADEYTYLHSLATCALMVSLARQLQLDESTCRDAGLAGLLHDIGKARVPEEILKKPGRLEDHEWQVMKAHPLRGEEMLRQAGIASDAALTVCRHHHERFDGSGYPDGLAGEAIPLLARMGAVCDVYDAITSDRPYKTAWNPAESLSRMATWTGHFDTAILHAFVRAVGIYPCGSLVRLESGHLAVVVRQHATALTRPLVRVFYSTRSNAHVAPRWLDLDAPDARDRILGRESPEQWPFPATELDSLWVHDVASPRRG